MRKAILGCTAAAIVLFGGGGVSAAATGDDKDCADIGAQVDMDGTGDPWLLDANVNGLGCESYAANGTVTMTSLLNTDVDIEAWAQQHKGEIKFFADVDVDKCVGLKGLTYEGAASMADARNIDLDALVKKADPGEIIEYVDSQGVTIAQLRALLDDFCAGEIPAPTATATTPGTPSPSATSGTDEPGATPTDDASTPADGDDDPSATPSDDAVVPPGDDSGLAETGGMSPWLPAGAASLLVGVGSGLFALRRKGIL